MAASRDSSGDPFICTVCQQSMYKKSPRQLLCSHVFCLTCLLKLKAPGNYLKCPTCAKKTLLDNGDVNTLPVSSIMIEKQPLCSYCFAAFAAKKCKDCAVLLCTSCIEKHDRLERFNKHSFADFCPEHHEGIIDYICLKCMKTACGICFMAYHSGHQEQVTSFEQAMHSFEADVNDWKDKASKKIDQIKLTRDKNEKMIIEAEERKAKLREHIAQFQKYLNEANKALAEVYRHETEKDLILSSNDAHIETYESLHKDFHLTGDTVADKIDRYKLLREKAYNYLNPGPDIAEGKEIVIPEPQFTVQKRGN